MRSSATTGSLGWVTSSTAVMTVKHIFSGVANGDNYDVSGPNSAKGSGKPLPMDKVNGVRPTRRAYQPGHFMIR